MSTTQDVSAPDVASTGQSLDFLLNELSSITGEQPAAEPEIEPDVEMQTDHELSDEELAAIELGETRAEVYDAQISTVSDATTTPAKAGKSRKVSAAPKPRARRVMADLAADTFKRHANEDADTAKAEILANPPKQVKVAEKLENLMIALDAGAKPSRYTVTGFSLLKRNGKVSSSEMVAAMKAEGMADGTARAQTGQIMALMPIVGVADRTGQVLTLRADSLIADRLSQILGIAA